MNQEKYISKEQWNLPIGHDENGNSITLKEYSEMLQNESTERMSIIIAENVNNKEELSIQRVIKNENYQSFQVGTYGEVDKDSAINAIKSQNELGKYLVKVEINTIQSVLKELSNE